MIDEDTKQKLSMSTVKLYEGSVLKKTVETDALGEFCFDVEAYKTYRVVATKIDYKGNEKTVEMKTQSQHIVIPLKKSAGITLDVLVIDYKTKQPIPAADVKLINVITKNRSP